MIKFASKPGVPFDAVSSDFLGPYSPNPLMRNHETGVAYFCGGGFSAREAVDFVNHRFVRLVNRHALSSFTPVFGGLGPAIPLFGGGSRDQ